MGFLLGAVGFKSQHSFFGGLGVVLDPVGELWTNSLWMIVLPLMCTYLFLSFAGGPEFKRAGRIVKLSVLTFAILLLLAVVLGAALAYPFLSQLVLDESTREVLAGFGELSEEVDYASDGSWVSQLVPSNLVAAAAKNQFLAVILATVLFALAVRKIPEELRVHILVLVRAVGEATGVLVGWLLKLMPLGVFALAYGITFQSGLSFAGTLGYYVVVECSLLIFFTVVVYFAAAVVGQASLLHFAWGVLPAQLVAVSTRSSLASLPSLIECARDRLKLQNEVTNLVLPLAVSSFKVDVSVTGFAGLILLTNLHDIHLTTGQVALFAVGLLVFSVSAPGIPTGGFPHTTPLYLAMGIPLESAMLLSAVGVLPDVFQTLLNVTANMSVATVVNRFHRGQEPEL